MPNDATRVDIDTARALVPSLAEGHVGGVHEPGARVIDVATLVGGYRRGLVERGGRILTAAPVNEIRPERGRWSITAGPHEMTAEFVVDAAGAWGDVVAAHAGLAPIGLRPLRRTAALVVAPDHVAGWPMVMDVDGTWYAEPEPGGLLVSPADETPSQPCDARPDEVDVALAIERVNAALGLQSRSVRSAWAGLRTFTPDRDPAVGPDPRQPKFVWLVGQGGSGIKTAPALAEIVARSIIAGDAVPPTIDVARFASADR